MIKYHTVDKIKIRYSDKGEGRTIVFIHGFPEALEIWDELSEKLSGSFRVIALDLPGHGESTSSEEIHTMDFMAHCVKALLNTLFISEHILVGHSMGGYVALACAEKFPNHLKGLCLFHSSALEDSEEKKKDRQRAIEVVKQDKVSFVHALIDKLFAPENVSRFANEIKKLKELCAKTPKEGIINALAGMRDRPNREHVLKNANFPVLFIIGKQDAVMPCESLLKQAALPKNSRKIILENSGHMGFVEQAEKAYKAIAAFAENCF